MRIQLGFLGNVHGWWICRLFLLDLEFMRLLPLSKLQCVWHSTRIGWVSILYIWFIIIIISFSLFHALFSAKNVQLKVHLMMKRWSHIIFNRKSSLTFQSNQFSFSLLRCFHWFIIRISLFFLALFVYTWWKMNHWQPFVQHMFHF